MSPPETVEAPAERCSFAAERRGDPMVGTAAPAVGVLLVEQPGPWGRQALTQSRLDPEVGRALSARAVRAGLRVLLVRRPGRPAAAPTRRWALADCRPGHETTRWGDLADDAELLDLPLDGSAGEVSPEATYLVCTHGRHDACCAIRGRPVAAALARRRPGQVWECSHIGGDRFAANLLTLPHGLYYGRVDDGRADEVVEAQEQGRVLLPLLRGRTTFAPVGQAAQQHARAVLARPGINELNPVHTVRLADDTWEVRLAHRPGDLLVTVQATTYDGAGLLTCHATHPAHPPAFRVGDLREAAR